MENFIEVEGIFENGYGFIAKKVMQDRNINVVSKGIYAYICSFSGKGNDCFPSRKKISYDLNISNDTLGKYLKELIENGYIVVKQQKENGKFSNNIYHINMTKLPYPKISDTVNTVYGQVDTNNNSNNNNNIYNNNNNNNLVVVSNEENSNNLFSYIEENLGRTLTPIEYEEISSWKDNDLTRYVIKESILKGGRSIRYMQTVLNAYEIKGIKTVEEAKQDELKHKQQIENKTKTIYKSKEERERERIEEVYKRFLEGE